MAEEQNTQADDDYRYDRTKHDGGSPVERVSQAAGRSRAQPSCGTDLLAVVVHTSNAPPSRRPEHQDDGYEKCALPRHEHIMCRLFYVSPC
jgi:hypothetical protein